MKTHLHPSKLTQSLQLLTPEEFKSFHKWLQSPWANSNKKLLDLYAFLKKYHPDFTSRSLTKENLFAKLYPGKTYDDKWMRNIMAGLAKQVERFLVHQRLEKDEITSQQFLADECLERHRSDWFVKQSKDLIKNMEKKEVKETEDYLNLALIQNKLYHYSNFKDGLTSLRIADLYLDTFYSISKWRNLTELTERKMILLEDDLTGEKIDLLLALTKNLNIPIIDLYRTRMKKRGVLEKNDYFQFKKAFLLHFNELPAWDRKLLFFYFINTVIRLWMKGDTEIVSELLDLYKKGIETGLLFHYGRVTEATYTNIITTAVSLKDFDFCEKFIEDYTSALSPASIQDGKTWAYAKIHYAQGEHDKCINLLVRHQFEESLFVRFSKFLLLQGYFDACLKDDSYYFFFKDYYEATKRYFNRDKVLTKKRNKAFILMFIYAYRIIKKVMDEKYTVADLQSIADELSEEKNIQGKRWLMEKINELKAGLSA